MVSLKTRSRSQEMHRGLLEDPLLVLGAANGHPVQRGDDHLLYAQWLHGDWRWYPGGIRWRPVAPNVRLNFGDLGGNHNFAQKCGERLKMKLVGGLEHGFYFSKYREFHHPNWRSHIFQRGRPNHQPGKGLDMPKMSGQSWRDHGHYAVFPTNVIVFRGNTMCHHDKLTWSHDIFQQISP